MRDGFIGHLLGHLFTAKPMDLTMAVQWLYILQCPVDLEFAMSSGFTAYIAQWLYSLHFPATLKQTFPSSFTFYIVQWLYSVYYLVAL